MAYKVLDLFKDLPRTPGCTDCGRPGCFPFATAVCMDGYALSECVHLDAAAREVIQSKLDADRAADAAGPDGPAIEQALVFLTEQFADADLQAMAERAGARYDAGPPEAIEVDLLSRAHLVARRDVTAVEGLAPSMWEKVFLRIYLTRATGDAPAGRWVALRELPNTASKVGEFERQAAKIANAFADRPGALAEVAARHGGSVVESDSADRAVAFRALPRVELLLLFWEGDEDFPARASILLDGAVLDYLDQEAIVFLAESLADRLTNE